ncbi:MAG: energy-coupling factor transporter transmembrane component T family protein [Candidatus Zixiibacteriota bacterium]
MFQNGAVMLGQYRPGDSFLHKLDTRAKIIPVTLVLVLALLTHSFIFYLIVLTALIVSLLASGVAVRALLLNFKPLVLIVLITFLYHLIFSGRDTQVLVDILGFKLTVGAVTLAAFFSLRLIIFISIAYLITLTSSPSEMAEALVKLSLPLQKIKISINDIGLILFIAIRFIPILYEEFTAIKNAQIIRGVSFSGSLIERLKKTTYILVPVFVSAVGRADDLALAIEARGYDGGRKRTFYSHASLGGREWLFMFFTMVGLLALFRVT